MLGKSLAISYALALAAVPDPAETRNEPVVDGPQANRDLNTHSNHHGYLPGRRSFYNYPRHRRLDDKRDGGGSIGRQINSSRDRSPNLDGNYGSPYYGTNYGAPYYGGGYYDGGVYYRERRD